MTSQWRFSKTKSFFSEFFAKILYFKQTFIWKLLSFIFGWTNSLLKEQKNLSLIIYSCFFVFQF